MKPHQHIPWSTVLGQFILLLLFSSLYHRVEANPSPGFSVKKSLSLPNKKDDEIFSKNVLQIDAKLDLLLPQNFNSEFLNWLHSSTQAFKNIYPLPHGKVADLAPMPGEDPKFQYSDGVTKLSPQELIVDILVSIPPGKEDNQLYYDHNLGFIIRNELFHVACYISNSNKLSPETIRKNAQSADHAQRTHIFMPFLNARGKIDKTLLNSFTDALNSAITRLQSLLAAFKKPVAKRTSKEAQDLASLEIFLKDYLPYVHVATNLSPEVLEPLSEEIVTKKNGRFLRFEDGTVHKIFSIRKQIDPKYGDVTHLFLTQHSNADSRLEVFFQDFRSAVADYENLSTYLQLTEKASTLFSYPPDLINFVAPEFCNYMTQYLRLNNNVCSLDDPVCSPPKQNNILAL